jgi:hypothetical protein
MPRMTLAGTALLVVLVGCRDGPTGAELPVEPRSPLMTQSIAQPDVLLTIQRMLDDPLVLEIVETLGDQSVTYAFEDLREELERQTSQADMHAMHRTLMSAREFLITDSEDDGRVLRDVLSLVLDDAGMMLAGDAEVAQSEDADGGRVKHRAAVKH